MNELQIFENEQFGKVRAVMINNESWLVGKDVVEALGYSLNDKNVASTYIKKYCDEEDYILIDKNSLAYQKGVLDYKQIGQRGGLLINESGLFSLVLDSPLPQAKQFRKWITSEVLPTIRKTGGYISNSDLMVNTYFGSCDETSKQLVKGLLNNIEEQQKQITSLKNEVTYKEDVIIGLTNEIDTSEKRQILNRVVRYNGAKYSERWSALYREFESKYHCDIKRRMETYNESNKPKVKSKLDYIDKVMNMLPQLYELATKLYENDINELVKEMYYLNEK